ncbi:MAG: DUF3617 domain-containing protein [Rhodocyclales bacterium]|jgi:hypothetical protein|nr:DUF3617 domain-containing protein [Rhodocyclales bacterium]MBI5786471.1 DUF3617 domain-containing protein [Rhodocyclales bacterium]
MKKTILAAALAVSAAGALAAADPAIRPGLWEVKLVRQTMDGRDVTVLVPAALAGFQQLMGNLTPQQRKQMEATFGRPPTTTTQRICISAEMAAGDRPLLPPDVKCEPTAFSREAGRVTFEFSCAEQGRTTTGKGESILASESVSTRIDMVTNDANGKHTWQNHSQATYVGADCGNLKPADQVVREAPKQ